MTPETIARRMGEFGHCVCPGFLSRRGLRESREDLLASRTAGKLRRAGVGRGDRLQIRDDERRDEIQWLDRAAANPVQAALWGRLDSLRSAMSRTLLLGLDPFEGHYTSYPAGGFYRRHLDCPPDGGTRRVSVIVYLNSEWAEADGGELRIFGADGSHRDIAPTGGTLACFLSRESEHEVRPSARTRLSFTGWFHETVGRGG